MAEDTWRTGVLDSNEDRRSTVDKTVAVAAEGDGPQVVLLLHRVTLAVEADVLNTSGGDHRFITGSSVIERVVIVIAALVNPCLIGLGSEFVLELDMVEAAVVDIKSVNRHRQIPSYGVL